VLASSLARGWSRSIKTRSRYLFFQDRNISSHGITLALEPAIHRSGGYDPLRSDPTEPGTLQARQAYVLAMRDYLERAGYAVRLDPDLAFLEAAALR
jgi:hypothetical protein